MTIHVIFADFLSAKGWLNSNLLLPLAAGLLGGLGVVGLIHFVWRFRKVVPSPPQKAKQADPFIHGSPTESRKSFRRKGNLVDVLVIDKSKEGEPIRGLVINRSVGGLCLQVDVPFAAEATLAIRPAKAPHIAPWVDVVVKSCRSGDRTHEIGCQFVKTPPWPVLMMFG